MSPGTTGAQNGLEPTERGVVRKDWRGRISVALVYPNTYNVGMSSLGFQAVYGLFNNFEDVVCERVFLPGDGEGRRRLRSIESNRPLVDFDIIAFSISFENDFPNLLTMLGLAGLPLRSSERPPPTPLVIAGGVTSLLNPEPLAPFVDCFLIGEAEAILPAFLETFRDVQKRQDLLKALAQGVPGAYVPSLYRVRYGAQGTIEAFEPQQGAPDRVRRAFMEDLSGWNTCTTVVSSHTAFDDTYLIEAARGCPYGCRFCAAGFVYRPPRFRPASQLESCVDKAAASASHIGLVAPDVFDTPGLESFCTAALARDLELSFSSLRADLLTSDLACLLKRSGVKTITIAPDAGSEKMRRVINKGISEQHVLDAVDMAVSAGIANIKLYFMVGLPEETMDDVEAIVSLCKKVRHRFVKASRAKAAIGQISVSLNAFVPKPFTPFQWVALDDVKALRAKIKHVKNALRRIANLRVHADLPRWAFIQSLFSRGDRRVGQLLLKGYKNGWNWPQTFKASVINPDFFVYRRRRLHERLPWDFIDHGIIKEYLEQEFKKALRQ
ncbi:MAG: radical SAM protein, partial [Deltaproteobacteria bacterium]|nr:radical SAM protein [Deltaproteobacteria bacterium]